MRSKGFPVGAIRENAAVDERLLVIVERLVERRARAVLVLHLLLALLALLSKHLRCRANGSRFYAALPVYLGNPFCALAFDLSVVQTLLACTIGLRFDKWRLLLEMRVGVRRLHRHEPALRINGASLSAPPCNRPCPFFVLCGAGNVCEATTAVETSDCRVRIVSQQCTRSVDPILVVGVVHMSQPLEATFQ